MARVLIVDDEENIRLVLSTLLTQHGYTVDTAANGKEALERTASFHPLFVLADVRMPEMDGITLCQKLRELDTPPTIIMMSAFGSIELALEAMSAGAYDYMSKPFKRDEVLLTLRKAEERESLKRANRQLLAAAQAQHRVGGLVGQSDVMKSLFSTIKKVASYPTTVLIQGESGTGKELVARAIHDESTRADKSFIAINCGAIPETLIESELFGHVKGAFTDASRESAGLFKTADGGTLFLDEIGELPQGAQVKLLRVIQEGVVRALGSSNDTKVDVRLVAATLKNLEEEVEEGRFREDLYYRLNVVQLRVPTLRERMDDIPLLLETFMERARQRLGADITAISPAAKQQLMSYPWPGNVRELENVVERAAVFCDGGMMSIEDLPDRVRDPDDPVRALLRSGELSIKKSQRYIEDQLIRRALEQTGGNRTAAARLLEISHRALLYKIKEFGIS